MDKLEWFLEKNTALNEIQIGLLSDYIQKIASGFAEYTDIVAVRNGAHEWTIGAGSETKRLTTNEIFKVFIEEYLITNKEQ